MGATALQLQRIGKDSAVSVRCYRGLYLTVLSLIISSLFSSFSGKCYFSRKCKKLEEIQNMIWKQHHTISHLQLNPDQIGEKGILLHIDRVKNTGPKMREEILRKIGNSTKKEGNEEKNSFISIRGR